MSVQTSGTAAGPAANALAHIALERGAVLVDRSTRTRLRFSGPKAAETLTGLVTSDVVALAPGQGQYSAALTPKGKVLADLRIFAVGDGLLVDAGEAAAPGFTAMIRKYVNPRLAKYEDVSGRVGDLGLFGAASGAMLVAALGQDAPLGDLSEYGHAEVRVNGETVIVARVPDFGVAGHDVFGPPETLQALRRRLTDLGAMETTGEALEAARIAAGRPLWGADMDDSMLAQEVDLDRLGAISWTKGCYTGQETVARVHYRGHVNRHLRGLQLKDRVRPPLGAELLDSEGKPVGAVRSSAVSPGRGPIALALVRREIEPGTLLRAVWPGHSVDAEVRALPFEG